MKRLWAYQIEVLKYIAEYLEHTDLPDWNCYTTSVDDDGVEKSSYHTERKAAFILRRVIADIERDQS